MSDYISNFNSDIRGLESGPKLVFLHGLMGSWANWRRIITAFESKYHILSFDQRGHGRSFRPEAGYSPEAYAEDLLKILDELNWGKVSIVGHSMGGRNAFVFAADQPERVEKLVIEDIGPEGSAQSVRKIELLLGRVPTPFNDKRVAKETILGAFENQVLAQYFYSNIAEVSPGVFDWRFSKEAILQSVREGRDRDRWDYWEKLKSPTLLIRGDRSDELDQETYEKMLAKNPTSTGVIIPDAGHWVHFDQPQLFIEALQNFLI